MGLTMTKLLPLLALTLGLSALQANAALTRSFMYDAAEDANVPKGFQPLSIDEAKAILIDEIKQSCNENLPSQLNWKTWTENPMSYGRQTYWISGDFSC
jgi:hypothetical protein